MKWLILLLISSQILFSQTFKITEGEVLLKATSTILVIEDGFETHGNGLSGEIDYTNRSFKMVYDLWNLDTGIRLRNEHMHVNYLETEDYPEAVYTGKIVAYSDTKISVEGVFSLHGVDQALNVVATRNGNQVTANWALDLEAYNIEIPVRFIILKLNKIVNMTATFQLEKL